ncbi:hypothetical protein P9112_007299 [Eukaryota sp. TZLM1-RC]
MRHKISLLNATGDYVIRVNVGDTILFDHPTEVDLQTEYPIKDHRSFKRGSFNKFPFSLSSFHGWTATLECRLPGSFSCNYSIGSSHYSLRIIIQPQLHVPLNCIMMETLIVKLIGPVHSWMDHFSAARKAGFNFIHLTPVQILGGSNSSYCIKDHTSFSPRLFPHIQTQKDQYDALRSFILDAKQKLNMRFTIDIIYNHAAADSPWLADHPECLYNLSNSPHLIPAFALDEVLMKASGGGLPENSDRSWFENRDVVPQARHSDGTSEVPPVLKGIVIDSEDQLIRVLNLIKNDCIPKARLWEYYVANKDSTLRQLSERLQNSLNAAIKPMKSTLSAEQVAREIGKQNGVMSVQNGERNQVFISIPVFVKCLKIDESVGISPLSLDSTMEMASKVIDLLNVDKYKVYDSDIRAAMCAVEGALRYKHLEEHGPKRRDPISAACPVVDPLFTRVIHSSGAVIPVANNGWVMGHKAGLQPDFVSPHFKCYMRREVIVWGDNVKLRYGRNKSDAPFLWKMMEQYTKMMAFIFDGFRIDNCHSTPLHVAEHLLDYGRKLNPHLFVVAELFTGSLHADLRFVKTLGINALIREASRADDHTSLSRTLWESATSDPVGSITPTSPKHMRMGNLLSLLYDCTHDNEPPSLTRTPHDTLSTMALVAGVPCPVGSVKGYDELIPHRICVVEEKRLYIAEPKVSLSPVRSFLSTLRLKLARDAFTEFHISAHDSGTIIIHRHCLLTFSSIYIIARTAFKFGPSNKHFELHVPGAITKCRFYATIDVPHDATVNFEKDPSFIKGLESNVFYQVGGQLPSTVKVKLLNSSTRSESSLLSFQNFAPGSVLVLEGLPSKVINIQQISEKSPIKLLDPPTIPSRMLSRLSFEDLHLLLYVSHPEFGKDMYWIPAFGSLPYAGIAGWKSVLTTAKLSGKSGHPVLEHLRAGAWALDYFVSRIHVSDLHKIVKSHVDLIKLLPWSLTPFLFTKLVDSLYNMLTTEALSRMSPWLSVKEGDEQSLPTRLALTSLQLVSSQEPLINDPSIPNIPSMAAGLPHFASGYMRNWGRDTFIALPGLLLITGRHSDARSFIIQYARTLRHGLIPNLMSGGIGSRYNARDATWFFLNAVRMYCETVANGKNILKEKIPLIFANDDADPIVDSSKSQRILTLSGVIYEILCRHAQGIHFRERNAGRQIDDRMQDEGFNIDISLDTATGFVFGGNKLNAGTWCDKMGSSERAGNKGIPATPRDGAPIELTALLAVTLQFAVELSNEHYFSNGVKLADGRFLSFSDWLTLIKRNFHRHYWVPLNASEDSQFQIDSKLVNRRGIYKDVIGSTHPWNSYQLRGNASVAIALCSWLFDHDSAVEHLKMASEILLKESMPGLKTLDPSDLTYRAWYNQSDNDDYWSSQGFSYHLGPAWLWISGLHCLALLKFDKDNSNGLKKIAEECFAALVSHMDSNLFLGATELLQADGSYCSGSCPTQAWSSATFLEALNYQRENFRNI